LKFIQYGVILKIDRLKESDKLDKDRKFFNCSQAHEINYLAGKFAEPKEEVIAKIKELCKAKVIHYSTHEEAEKALIDAGFTKK
jgi:hypothetical protein